jgi:8-oxo-dGTP diphosphatase
MRDYWEFPGGKVDASESAERALQRELAEELGIEIFDPRHFRSIRHAYPDLAVSINFYLVRNWTGTPRGAEGQSIRWVAKDALVKHRLLPADLPVIEALAKLPRGDSADT